MGLLDRFKKTTKNEEPEVVEVHGQNSNPRVAKKPINEMIMDLVKECQQWGTCYAIFDKVEELCITEEMVNSDMKKVNVKLYPLIAIQDVVLPNGTVVAKAGDIVAYADEHSGFNPTALIFGGQAKFYHAEIGSSSIVTGDCKISSSLVFNSVVNGSAHISNSELTNCYNIQGSPKINCTELEAVNCIKDNVEIKYCKIFQEDTIGGNGKLEDIGQYFTSYHGDMVLSEQAYKELGIDTQDKNNCTTTHKKEEIQVKNAYGQEINTTMDELYNTYKKYLARKNPVISLETLSSLENIKYVEVANMNKTSNNSRDLGRW